MNAKERISRRGFLKQAGIIGGGIVFGAVGLSTLARCTENANSEMKDFQSKALPFKMKLTHGWTTEDRDISIPRPLFFKKDIRKEGGVMELNKDAKNLIIITVLQDEIMLSADEYTDGFIKALKTPKILKTPLEPSDIRSYSETEIKEVAKIVVNNQETNIITYSESWGVVDQNKDRRKISFHMNETARRKFYIFRDGRNIWLIQYLASPSEFEKGVLEFDQMVSTFQVTEKR